MYTSLIVTTALLLGAPAPKEKVIPLGEGPGYLGIRFSKGESGMVISDVVADSPAQKAKLEVGDEIIKINDLDLSNLETNDFVNKIAEYRPNQMIELKFLRDGKTVSVKLRLDKRPENFNTIPLRPTLPPIDD